MGRFGALLVVICVGITLHLPLKVGGASSACMVSIQSKNEIPVGLIQLGHNRIVSLALFLADLINDKSDGFLDHLLPNHQLTIVSRGTICRQSLAFQFTYEMSSAVCAIMGPSCSSELNAMTDLSVRHSLPLISPSATNEELKDVKKYPFFTRVITDDSVQGQLMTDLLNALGIKRIGIVYKTGDYGESIKQSVVELSSAKNISIVSIHELEYQSNANIAKNFIKHVTESVLSSQLRYYVISLTGSDIQWIEQSASFDAFMKEHGVVIIVSDSGAGALPSSAGTGRLSGLMMLRAKVEDTSLMTSFRSRWLVADEEKVIITCSRNCKAVFGF